MSKITSFTGVTEKEAVQIHRNASHIVVRKDSAALTTEQVKVKFVKDGIAHDVTDWILASKLSEMASRGEGSVSEKECVIKITPNGRKLNMKGGYLTIEFKTMLGASTYTVAILELPGTTDQLLQYDTSTINNGTKQIQLDFEDKHKAIVLPHANLVEIESRYIGGDTSNHDLADNKTVQRLINDINTVKEDNSGAEFGFGDTFILGLDEIVSMEIETDGAAAVEYVILSQITV